MSLKNKFIQRIVVNFSIIFTAISVMRDGAKLIGYEYNPSGSIYLVSLILVVLMLLFKKEEAVKN